MKDVLGLTPPNSVWDFVGTEVLLGAETMAG